MSDHVLELDGAIAHVSLPDGLLDDLDEITIEAWIKWHGLGSYGEVLGFGAPWQVLGINNDGTTRTLQFFIYSQVNELHVIRVPGILRLHQWYHVVAINSRTGMQLYVNGVLVGAHGYSHRFARICGGKQNYLGRSH